MKREREEVHEIENNKKQKKNFRVKNKKEIYISKIPRPILTMIFSYIIRTPRNIEKIKTVLLCRGSSGNSKVYPYPKIRLKILSESKNIRRLTGILRDNWEMLSPDDMRFDGMEHRILGQSRGLGYSFRIQRRYRKKYSKKPRLGIPGRGFL